MPAAFLWILALVLGGAAPAPGQLLSAGPLAQPHAELEGLSNCTRCHTAGKQVTDDRCLACHNLLAARLRENAGYHAHVQGDCVDCHNDHRGRDYRMIIWQPASFDHDSTGYALTGKHGKLDCDRCHKKERTYLGLQPDCLSCHVDEHRAQLGAECLDCHDVQSWKPARGFAHQRTGYALAGRHRNVACERCHVTETDTAGGHWRRYRPLSFAACTDCHDDEHQGQFAPRACTDCHDIDGFKPGHIDHQLSRFPLQGRHRTVACGDCHGVVRAGGRDSTVAYRPLPFKRCADCHADTHRGQFQRNCGDCHRVEGWRSTSVDHEQTRFPLRGRHRRVACSNCHTRPPKFPQAPTRYRGLAFAACGDCHADLHAGQFESDCATCHDVDGWKLDSFDHQRTRFALQGKHADLTCDRCHPVEAEPNAEHLRRWRGIAFADCGDCHEDTHRGQFEADCAACHDVTGFKPATFDHRQARFHLDGAHLDIRCAECHKTFNANDGTPLIRYRPLDADCGACHV